MPRGVPHVRWPGPFGSSCFFLGPKVIRGSCFCNGKNLSQGILGVNGCFLVPLIGAK